MRACAVVLAAGAGRRAGGPKAEMRVGGRRLVDRAVDTAWAGGCAEVIAVVRRAVAVPRAQVVVNPDPDRGLGSSFALGLDAARSTDADCVLVLLVDQPGITAGVVARVLAATDDGPRLWFARFASGRSHPVRIDQALSGDVAASLVSNNEPDAGARGFARSHPNQVREVDCEGLGDPRDLDTAEQLRRWAD